MGEAPDSQNASQLLVNQESALKSRISNTSDLTLQQISSIFIDQCRKSPNGKVTLSDIQNIIGFKKRRRIYDVTNVLEGVGLITRSDRGEVAWKGEEVASAVMTFDYRGLLQEKSQLESEYLEEYEKLKEILKSDPKINLDLLISEGKRKGINFNLTE